MVEARTTAATVRRVAMVGEDKNDECSRRFLVVRECDRPQPQSAGLEGKHLRIAVALVTSVVLCLSIEELGDDV